MLGALNPDDTLHKRLGDGYYEQKLVNEQVARLTGYRRLDGYSNDEEQFKALMEAGITFAREQQLTPGIRLSAEQIARLTSDIVWLETQTLTLIDGSTVDVLAPKVYLTVKPGDINAHGGLISADKLAMDGTGSIINSGTLAGRKIVDLAVTDITNSGVVQGGKVRLRGQDVNIEGGTVEADTLLAVEADRIRVASTTVTGGDERNGQTQIDRVAGLYVNNASDGLLSLKANESINFVAANLRNEAAKGQTQIVSDGRIDLGTAKLESHSKRGELSDRNHRHVTQTSEAGTTISAAGDILISAKDDLSIRQGSIASDEGSVSLYGRNVSITEGRQTLDLDESVYSKSRGFASKKSSLDQYRRRHDEAVGSEISGAQVLIAADNDLTVRGSNVVSDGLTLLTAGNDADITAAQSSYHDSEFHQTKKSGLMGSGGIGFTIGSKKDAADSGSRTLVNHGSTVGSLTGDTVISAAQNYRQTGSTVSAPEGDVLIRARNIDIEAAQDTYATDYQHTFEQKGLTVAVNVPVVQAVQSAVAAAKTVGQSKNDRVNAMAAANTAWQTRQLLAKESHPANLKGLSDTAAALSDGDLKSAADAANISVSFTYGQQKNTDQSHTEGTTAQGSQVIGGGQVSLMADEGRLNITGSDVAGKEGTLLRAQDIVLQSAEQHHSERSDNRSSGWNAGVAVALQSGKPAVGFTVGGNRGKGYGNGDDVTHRHSRIGDADGHTVIQSSVDTTLKGAQVSGKGIALTARNLNIESVQDSAVYRSRQQNISGSVTVGYGASASADYNRSKTNADHLSVTEQSGLFAGDDGFQVNVKNHTDLKGGMITSSEAAEQNGKNRFQTATLNQSDIHNHSRYDADGFGIGVSATLSGQTLGQKAPEAGSHIQNVAGKNSIGSTLGYGSDGGKQSSVTKSGISTRNIVIGNDSDGTQAKAAYTATRSETAEANSGRLNNAFDKEKVQNEIDLQRNVSQDFSRNVSQIKGEIGQQIDRLKAEKEVGEISEAEYRNKLQNLQYLNVGISSIATALMTPTDSALGITAAAARPAVSYRIGQYFKENEVSNQLDGGNRPTEGSKEHIALHTLNGILTGAAGGSNALLSGLASGGAELIAPTLSRSLYNKESKDLSAEEKATISSLTAVFGAAVGAASGNGSDAVAGSLTAQNTAENNDNFRLDGYTPDERSIRNYAGKIYSGDKQKAAEFIREYEKYQLTAMLKAGKEIIVDTWDTIRHPVDSAASLYEAVTNPKQTYKNIVLSYQEWNTLYNNALITDIPLAARMKAEMNATIGANASAIIISGGTAALVQKSLQTGKLAQTVRVVKNTVKIPDSIPTTSINPNTIRFSQNTVSYSKIDRATGKPFTYDDLVSSMKTKGWQGEPVDIIKMPDNKLTSMDNTRIRAARDAGINVKANVHNFNDPLPDRMITSGRFGDAKTWGEAITKRISDQRPKSFGNNNPSGTPTAPKITGKSK
ncbi:hypothetical protein GJV52_12645 [Neisseria brasiliensis]|uniref:hemagglutinin repeat-containing protein n=1 Tax=Neisseria brasiliensis TaxID=2666100 RepID=UPI0012AA4116|nr:hemagglutinin repeat-containing protein [Neisseria brasiliensis]QGL26300.1 hypothetical protein GJV52_12645 [Neisseria brasiliensis]